MKRFLSVVLAAFMMEMSIYGIMPLAMGEGVLDVGIDAATEMPVLLEEVENVGGLSPEFVDDLDDVAVKLVDGDVAKEEKDEAEVQDNASNIPIDEKHFPDKVFRSYVKKQFGGGDDILTKTEIDDVRWIYVSDMGISKLTGIEYFTNLEELSCDDNKLTSLNLKKNGKIKYLRCGSNKLTSLDVSGCSALETLYCNSNKLTKLVLGKTKVREAYCYNNKLKTLDVSKCSYLESLDFSDNRLGKVNLDKNTKLKSLNCDYNSLTKLDVSKCKALTELSCCSNGMTTLTLGNNRKLEKINCNNNKIKALNVSKCTALETLICEENALTKLTLGKNTKLTSISCGNNKIKTLNVSQCTALESLDCSRNKLTKLTLGKNTKLEEISCFDNSLEFLDVSKCTALIKLYASNNKLKKLTLGKHSDLKRLGTEGNLLTAIDISKCPIVISTIKKSPEFEQYDSYFSWNGGDISIDADTILISGRKTVFPSAGNIAVNKTNFPDEYFREYVQGRIDKNENGLLSKAEQNAVKKIELDYSDGSNMTGIELFPNLETLDCSENDMKSLDLKKNKKLKVLKCYDNELHSLELSNNTQLATLQCYSNSITSLDIANCPTLIGALDGTCSIDDEENVITWSDGALSIDKGTKIMSGDKALYPPEGAVAIDSNSFPDYEFREYVEDSIDTIPDGYLTEAERNAVTKIDVDEYGISSLVGIHYFTNLEEVECAENYIATLDTSFFPNLKSLDCSDNRIKMLDLSSNTNLVKLDCSDNELSTIDVSMCNSLKALYCAGNSFSEFDVSKLPQSLSAIALKAKWHDDGDEVYCVDGDYRMSFPSGITLYNGSTVIFPVEDEDESYY